jgi:dCTP deaminase
LRLPQLIQPYSQDRVVNCSYELSVGAEAFVTGADMNTKTMLAAGEQVDIPPGQFANLLTEERVEIPASALGLISVKFRLKQRGLVNVSGFHVDPGFAGRLLFSVYNAGPSHVILSRGDAAFLLWFADLEAPTANTYVGARVEQMSISSADVNLLVGDVGTPQALAERVTNLEKGLAFRVHVFWLVIAAIVSVCLTLIVQGARDSSHGTTTTSTIAVSSTTTAPPTTTSTSVAHP